MTRKLKVLGIAFVAVFAMSAIASAAASAADFSSTSGTGSTILEGTQTTSNVFKVTQPAGTTVAEVHCTTAKFTGTVTGNTVEQVTAHPTYSGCEASPFGSATVTTTGCNYILHAAGTVDVECESGKNITIAAPGCTITVGAQTGLASVSYTNSGSPSTVNVKTNVSGIHYTSSGSFCSFFGVPSSGSLADYTGSVNVKGYADEGGVKGAQVSLAYNP